MEQGERIKPDVFLPYSNKEGLKYTEHYVEGIPSLPEIELIRCFYFY
jgi:hypothetical protein